MTIEDSTLWQKVAEHAWAGVLALGSLVWKNQNEKIATMGDEIKRQRDVAAKLFDKLEAHGQRAEDRHHELLTALHEGLARKADK